MRRMKKVLLKAKVLHVKPCYTLLYSSIHIGPRSYASVQCSSVLFAGLSQMATYNTANVLKNKSPCWSRKWVGNLLQRTRFYMVLSVEFCIIILIWNNVIITYCGWRSLSMCSCYFFIVSPVISEISYTLLFALPF